jgi:hypothetical protein
MQQQQHRSSGGYQTTVLTSSKGPKNVERGKTREGNERKATSSGNKVIFPKDRVPREVRASEREITARRRRRRQERGRQAGDFFCDGGFSLNIHGGRAWGRRWNLFSFFFSCFGGGTREGGNLLQIGYSS